MTAPIDTSHGALEAEARAWQTAMGCRIVRHASSRPCSHRANVAGLAGAHAIGGWQTPRVRLRKPQSGCSTTNTSSPVASGRSRRIFRRGYTRAFRVWAARGRRPRIWSIARTVLRVSRLQLSALTLTQFLDAYQERTPLSIAELWALPTFLRLGCLEVLFAAFQRLDGSLRPPFAIDDPPDVALEDTECGRAISNLRIIASISWKDLFCRTGRVEAILHEDPAHLYQRMDFETRDALSSRGQQLARNSPHSEMEVAQRAVACARQAVGGAAAAHGRRLLARGRGRRGVRAANRLRPTASTPREPMAVSPCCRSCAHGSHRRHRGDHRASSWYLTVARDVTVGDGADARRRLAARVHAGRDVQSSGSSRYWCLPRLLPKLDFEAAFPDECRTAVVIPRSSGSVHDARRQLERLELHYPRESGAGGAVRPLERLPGRVERAGASDEEHPDGPRCRSPPSQSGVRTKPFHVLHRPRRFNPAEGVWMAWERKRGSSRSSIVCWPVTRRRASRARGRSHASSTAFGTS